MEVAVAVRAHRGKEAEGRASRSRFNMFRRKSKTKGAKGRGNSKAKKAVKRLLEKPSPERVAAIADLAAQENQQPFGVSDSSIIYQLYP